MPRRNTRINRHELSLENHEIFFQFKSAIKFFQNRQIGMPTNFFTTFLNLLYFVSNTKGSPFVRIKTGQNQSLVLMHWKNGRPEVKRCFKKIDRNHCRKKKRKERGAEGGKKKRSPKWVKAGNKCAREKAKIWWTNTAVAR